MGSLKRIGNYLSLGLLFSCIAITSSSLNLLPEFVEGICVGLGLTFIFMSIISTKYDISKIRNIKMSFLRKAFGNKYN